MINKIDKNFVTNLPVPFKQIVRAMPHFDGGRWLDDLPQIIEQIEKKWLLKAEKHYRNLSFNYVAPCICSDGKEAVLKIGLPQKDSELFDEARALKLFDGKGSVRLLKFDKELEVLLLEKISPGKNLKEVFENEKEKAVDVACDLLKKIIQKPPENGRFRDTKEWFIGFEKALNTEFPKESFDRVAKLLEKLDSNCNQRFLLHSDFHHENILSSEREEFLAIDPKGMIGNIGYEIAVFLNNHAVWLQQETDQKKKLNKAVRQFSETFEIPEKELKDWAYAQQVLGAWWNLEDNIGNWKKDLAFAGIWRQTSLK